MASANNGNFVWYETLSNDLKASIAYYTEVVGWKTQPFEGTDYIMWASSQGPLGGVIKLPDELAKMGVPPHWMAHVKVANVDAACAQVKRLGGRVNKEPTDIPTVGRFAVISDPQGATLSMFQPSGDMTLHDMSKHGEFCWHELMTSDSVAAFTFYSEIFGWKVIEEMDMGPMGKYRLFGIGDTRFGGMMDAPKDSKMPPAWLYYVNTDNLDAAIDRATKRGGKVMNGPMDVPGGRIAQMTDPQGAWFALHMEVKK